MPSPQVVPLLCTLCLLGHPCFYSLIQQRYIDENGNRQVGLEHSGGDGEKRGKKVERLVGPMLHLLGHIKDYIFYIKYN